MIALDWKEGGFEFLFDIVMYNDNNGNSSNGGNKGKWNERLFKMRKNRLRIKKSEDLDSDKFSIKNFNRNILKVVLAVPSMIYSNIKDTKNLKDRRKKMDSDNRGINPIFTGVEEIGITKVENVTDRDKSFEVLKNYRVDEIREIDVSLLRKKYNDLMSYSGKFDGIGSQDDDCSLKKVQLQREIIHLIKKKLVKNINELEMLHSDFYVLNELGNGGIYLDECKEDIKEIKRLLSKVKVLKEKYDYLRDNVDFEYMLEYDDDSLVDKILELKELCSGSDVKQTIDDYKVLDEYKYLYLKIDKLQEDAIKYEEYKNKKAEELRKRDIDFEKIKMQLYDIDREKEKYDRFVNEQELILQKLNEKIAKIDSYEKVTYRLKGFHQLLGNSFKYLGLLLINPLKGIVPGIVTQTLITKNVIHNLYNNLSWEENRKMVYEAINYSDTINAMLNNLDDTSSLVDSTLEEIICLKNKYMNEFSQYEGAFSSYKEAIRKLNKIENAVLGNKIKIDNMRLKMKEKEKENNNKLKMVKKLNDGE